MKALVQYFFLTFVVTWGLWFAAVRVIAPAAPNELLMLPGTIAPALVALWLTRRIDGADGVRTLTARLFAWRLPARWYVFALGYMAGIKLLVAVIHRLVFDVWPRFGDLSPVVLLIAIAFSTVVQAGEETGWRGFALPRLAAQFGLRTASVVLGVLWAAWHLPLFYLLDSDVGGQSFPVYLMGVTALSVAMAWLYARTRGSLLLVMLMHAAVNNTTGIVPGASVGSGDVWALHASPVGWLTILLLWLGAAYFLIRMPQSSEQSERGRC